MENVVYLHHARASSQTEASGRGTSSGHLPSGQLSENHRKARSKRPTLMSEPLSSAVSFLPSLKARELTVDKGTPSISPYARATLRSCSMPDIGAISVNLPVLSTVNLPDVKAVSSGQSTGMDTKLVLDNIERLLKAKGRKADAVSRAAGVPDAIRNLRRHVQGKIKAEPTLRTLGALADELGVDEQYLRRPHEKPIVQPAPGLREQIMRQIEYLEQEKQRAIAQLEALDEAEAELRKPQKRKMR